MKIKILGISTVVLLFGTALLSAQDKPTLAVTTEKVLYDSGETAKFDVTVSNGTKARVKGTLLVKVIWEMEDSAQIKEAVVELAPGDKQVISATWKTADVLGCEVRADLRDGQQVIATGVEYFNVCPTKDMQRVGIHVMYPDLFTFPGKDYLDTIPQKVAGLRQAYGNIVEHYACLQDYFADLAPPEDVWCGSYWESKVALQKAVAEEHKHGLKALLYAAGVATSCPGAELQRRHPEWFLYKENSQLCGEGDVSKLDSQQNADGRAGIYFAIGWGLGAFPNFSLKAPLEYGVQQLIASKKMFNWDGVRFDGHFIMWTDLFPGARDMTGKLVVSGKAAEPINRANTDYTRKKVAETYPDYLFMFNSDVVHESDIAEVCRDGGAAANEPIRTASELTTQWHTWKAFAQYLLDDVDGTRKLGGYAYAYLPPVSLVCPNVDRIQYALLFAAGDHPWFSFPARDENSDKGGSHFPVQKDYFRFATRFSAALWGRGIERVKVPEEIVAVSAPQGTVWWRDFVHQRKLANGRQQIVVHLVNAPLTPTIEAEAQPLPAPLKDVLVKFKKPVRKVWLATSQPELSYRLLPVNNGTVKVPELSIWSMVIAEREGK